MNVRDIERLFQRFLVGDAVRAAQPIFFANTGITVAAGTLGTVEKTRVHDCISLVLVAFEGAPLSCITSVENLDPVAAAGAPS